jgi:hypothetical protein
MHTIRSPRLAAAVLAAALAASVPLMGACGSSVEQAAEQAAEQALGGDVNIEGDSMTMTDEEGNEVAVGEGISLPDTWPDSVPAFEGGTLGVASVNADGTASGMWTTDAASADAVAAYGAALESAGFTQSSTSAMGDLNIADYTGNGLTVNVSAIAADGTTTVVVTVTPG